MDIMDHADPKSNIRYEMGRAGTEGRVGEEDLGAGEKINKTSDPILGKDGVGGSILLTATILPYISMALTDETARNCSEPFANERPAALGKVGKMLALPFSRLNLADRLELAGVVA